MSIQTHLPDWDLWHEAVAQAKRLPWPPPPGVHASNYGWPLMVIYHQACRTIEAHPRHADSTRALALQDMARFAHRMSHPHCQDTLL